MAHRRLTRSVCATRPTVLGRTCRRQGQQVCPLHVVKACTHVRTRACGVHGFRSVARHRAAPPAAASNGCGIIGVDIRSIGTDPSLKHVYGQTTFASRTCLGQPAHGVHAGPRPPNRPALPLTHPTPRHPQTLACTGAPRLGGACPQARLSGSSGFTCTHMQRARAFAQMACNVGIGWHPLPSGPPVRQQGGRGGRSINVLHATGEAAGSREGPSACLLVSVAPGRSQMPACTAVLDVHASIRVQSPCMSACALGRPCTHTGSKAQCSTA